MTEGSGVGTLKEPPVTTKIQTSALVNPQTASSLSIRIDLTDCVDVKWETILMDRKLFVEIPNGILPQGSKESFVTLLEYAEEELNCTHVIVCFRKDRSDRAPLIRTFMFLGFVALTPNHVMVPKAPDLMFMAYAIE